MKCFKCYKPIKSSTTFKNDVYEAPAGATMWSTTGNYGSSMFDELSDKIFLIIAICDGCFYAHKDKIIRGERIRSLNTQYRKYT